MRTLVLVLLCCVFTAGHPVHLLEEKATCDAPVATLVRRALAEDVLKTTALEWSGTHMLLDWKFANVADGMARALPLVYINNELKQSASIKCVVVSYTVSVKTPAFVSMYASRVDTRKTVCSTDDTVFEQIEFEGLPIMDNLSVAGNIKFLQGRLQVTTATEITLPALLSATPFLESSVEAYVKKRWSHKNELFVHELCSMGGRR